MRIAEWAPSPSAAEHVLSSCTVLRPSGRARVSSVSSSCESAAAGASRTSWQHTAATPRSKTRERRQCTCGEEGAMVSTCMREDARATPVHLQRRSRGRSRCRRRRRHLLHSRFGDVPLQGAAVLGDEFGLRVRIAVGDVDAPLLARLQRCSAVSAAERALQPAERPSPWVSFCNPGSSALISAHQRSSALISAQHLQAGRQCPVRLRHEGGDLEVALHDEAEGGRLARAEADRRVCQPLDPVAH